MSKKCGICIKSVYPMDPQMNFDGELFHKECAKCADCRCQITLSNFTKGVEEGKILLLCKTHYVKRFHTTGTFTGEEKFARKQNGGAAPAIISAGSIAPTPTPAPEQMTSTGPAYAGIKLRSASFREESTPKKASSEGGLPAVSLRKVSASEKSESTKEPTTPTAAPTVLLKKASERELADAPRQPSTSSEEQPVILKKASERVLAPLPTTEPSPAAETTPAKRWSFKEKTATSPVTAPTPEPEPEPEVQETVFQVEENPTEGKPAAVAGFMKRKGKMNKCFFVLRDGMLSQYEDEVKPEGGMEGTELMCAPINLKGCQIASPMPKKISIVTPAAEVELEANNAGNCDKWMAAMEQHKTYITELRKTASFNISTKENEPMNGNTMMTEKAEAAASRRASMKLNPFQMEESPEEGQPAAVCGYMNKDGSTTRYFFILRNGAITQYEGGDDFEGTNQMGEPVLLRGATVASPEKRIILVETPDASVRYEASNTMVCDKWIKAFQSQLSFISNFKAGSLSGNVGLVDDYLTDSKRNSIKADADADADASV